MGSISYREAGVDIDAGDELVERIKPFAKMTRIPEVLADVGGFAGLCAVPQGIEEPVMVSGTDGVGTKLKVAFLTGVHDTIGQDLVGMCVNDIITCGARPLFFLDYFGTGKLSIEGNNLASREPLRHLPLTNLSLDYDSARDLELLTSIETLVTVNDKPIDALIVPMRYR